MDTLLYNELADWWHLLSSPDEYAAEAARFWELITSHAKRPIETILEFGCGGGNNAVHLARHARMTLTDVSPHMLAVSRRHNPQCEHIAGDMRTLRIDRRFDAVLIQDAIMYMTNRQDLRAAIQTAHAHCADGGVALLVPDCTRETWQPSTDHGGHDGDGRALRYLSWTHDPDPADDEFLIDYAYLLRSADGAIRLAHDRHRNGLFSTATWLDLLERSGFRATVEQCGYPGGENARCFVGGNW